MAKYSFTVFGTATTVKVYQFKEFPKPGLVTPIANTNWDSLYFGGKAWNIFYDLISLGVKCYPVLAYSDSRFEAEFKRVNKEFGVPLNGIHRSPEGDYDYLSCIVMEDFNRNHITIGGYQSSSSSFTLEDLKTKHLEMKDEYMTDSEFALLTCPKPGDIDFMLELVKKSGKPMVFSMSHDPLALPKESLEPVLRYASIIFANEDEVEYIEDMYGYDSIKILFERGNAQIIVKTLGKSGCVVYQKEGTEIKEYLVPITENKVGNVNAIGAGDAFVAGFLYGFINGKDVETCAQYGSTVSSFVIEDLGSCTTAPTVEQMLNRNETRPDAK